MTEHRGMTRIYNEGVRILYVHGVTEIGGAERDLLTWLENFDRTRFHPYVVCAGAGLLTAALQNLKIPFAILSLPAWRKFFHLLRQPFALLQLIRLIRHWQIDVLHVNDYWWAPHGVLTGYLTGRPCLIHVRQEIEPRKISKYWLNKADLIIPVSQSIGNVILNAGVPSENIQVLLSGIVSKSGKFPSSTAETFATLKKVKGQPVIGTVANLFPRKGLEYLIEALAILKKTFPHSFLVIVGKGDGEYEQQLLKQVKDLGLTKHVLFAGFQDHPEMFISHFDIFVLPSVLEGFGIVLLEAMSLGKPIVASKVGGIPEIVQQHKTGLLVKPADVEDLSQGILALAKDPEKRIRMGKAGKKRLETHFTLQRMMERLYGLYSDVLLREFKKKETTR